MLLFRQGLCIFLRFHLLPTSNISYYSFLDSIDLIYLGGTQAKGQRVSQIKKNATSQNIVPIGMHLDTRSTNQPSGLMCTFASRRREHCGPRWNYLKPESLTWVAVGATSPKHSNKSLSETWTGPDGSPKQDNVALFWQMNPQKYNNCIVIVLEASTRLRFFFFFGKKIKFVKMDLTHNLQISRNIHKCFFLQTFNSSLLCRLCNLFTVLLLMTFSHKPSVVPLVCTVSFYTNRFHNGMMH